MDIKKGLILGTAIGALHTTEAKENTTTKIQDDTKKSVQENIGQNQTDKKNTIHRDKALLGNKKQADEKEKIKEMRENIDTNITHVEIDKNLTYITFVYKNIYNIKYEPNPIEWEAWYDIILLTDSTTKKTYEIEIAKSLFTNKLTPKDKKIEVYKTKMKERLIFITKIHTQIEKQLSEKNLLANEEEAIYIKDKNIYFEAKKATNKNKKWYDKVFFTIKFEPEKQTWNTTIEEKFIIKELQKNDYFTKAYL